jgi:type II secretory pathway component PulK
MNLKNTFKKYALHCFISEESSTDQPQRGVALIVAILSVTIIMMFGMNFIINSYVKLELATAQRDNFSAEYMAKSGVNLAAFLLSIDYGVDLVMESGRLGPKTPASDSPSDMWSMLNGLPIGGETADMLGAMQEQFSLSAVADDRTINTLKLFKGQFILDIQDESGKININKCVVDGRCPQEELLTRLFQCPAEDLFFKNKGVEPAQMAERIKDWVDTNSTTVNSGFSTEDDPYQKYDPPYRAKNGPIDTVSELKLIEGWDDDLHTVFSPYITGFPYFNQKDEDSRININSAPKALLGCLLAEGRRRCQDRFDLELNGKAESAMASTDEEIKTILSEDFCVADSKVAAWFGVKSRSFRIKVMGLSDRQVREIDTVIERQVPDPAKKKLSSYQTLYWRMF